MERAPLRTTLPFLKLHFAFNGMRVVCTASPFVIEHPILRIAYKYEGVTAHCVMRKLHTTTLELEIRVRAPRGVCLASVCGVMETH